MNILLIVLAIIILGLVAFLYSARAVKKACRYILDDLKRQKAVTPETAIDLPYCKKQLLHFGLRDYRPDALIFLVKHDFVRVAEGGKFYLGKDFEPEDADGNPRP